MFNQIWRAYDIRWAWTRSLLFHAVVNGFSSPLLVLLEIRTCCGMPRFPREFPSQITTESKSGSTADEIWRQRVGSIVNYNKHLIIHCQQLSRHKRATKIHKRATKTPPPLPQPRPLTKPIINSNHNQPTQKKGVTVSKVPTPPAPRVLESSIPTNSSICVH